ncbi:MAG: riboflavin biosynthesis protein RibF [Omnitrophica WOR_2 bacterium GWF2_43_52]|nr:MAG: riboflavin biosynthesis protein RibF [Omnitrophica WOR_2 bacterium GWC2_44_8]OGX20931.1 MAG: riboflavin biosynthesis protein RibF [Omnitrophica WOR_2 bacterium GWF2_43_52]OGX55070.1 MAG: riboflavin biosynthesis protein RibF [Omnitrophica WOR_2 bacterium RIFOXYC2_FULL_43_9]HAH21109.1 hypothetical protein [Candidatus Omnitrophota bacterium]HBG63289.1 hypothetical protein [Candidatus Omnitrophota bacterium]
MKTTFGLSNLSRELHNTVVVIGVFDGLHRGHRYLINKAAAAAKKLHASAVCITFDPHPKGEPYLISLKHRLRLIEAMGIDYCVVITFNTRFAAMPAESFVKDILVKRFHPQAVFVGSQFRFGYRAQGDAALLASLGEDYGFKGVGIKELHISGQKASSRHIRDLIRTGKLSQAKKLLGRDVSVLGTVIRGKQRGRILGYPTANINPHHEVLPQEGVYAVKVMYKCKVYKGVCNIGYRPTFGSSDENKTVEVHMCAFSKEIYGEDIEINFIRKIRDEKKFSSSEALRLQIKKDQQKALQYLSS